MTGDSTAKNSQVNQKFIDDLGRIEQALRLRVGYRVHDLRLWVEAHGLVLTGHASSYYDKQLAQHVVKELTDLLIAENRIVVDLPPQGSGLNPGSRWGHHRLLRRNPDRPQSMREPSFALSRCQFVAQ